MILVCFPYILLANICIRRTIRFGGFERYLNYGCEWNISLEHVERKRLPAFFRMPFNGMIVCDMDSLYAIFNVGNIGYFKIPIGVARYFYIVKYDGLKDWKNLSLYRMKKYAFSFRMNIVSVNERDILSESRGIECKMSTCVNENYKVHDDTFVVGCKMKPSGVMLTSNFVLGDISYFGITCYISFRKWIKENKKMNYKLLKRYFCYPAFRNQIMAMYQCVKCYKVLEMLLTKMLCFWSI